MPPIRHNTEWSTKESYQSKPHILLAKHSLMPTVCIDCRYASPKPSGIGELVTQLAELAPLIAPDLNFVLIRHERRSQPLSAAANVREIVTSCPANGPGTLWFLPHILDLSKINLFHAPANILPAGLKMRTLTTIHDIMWLVHPKWCNPRPYGYIERAFYGHGIKRALRSSDHIATVSEATRQAIRDFDAKLTAPITVTRSGVDPGFAPLMRDEAALARLGLPEGCRFILVVGQNAPYKNHAGAMHAFARAFSDDPSVHMVLVQRRNAGPASLSALTRSLAITDRTHFIEHIERRELIQLYAAAEALLHPSLCEGFGNPIAEAMASGCPVITSNCSAMPEIAGGAAKLIDPKDIAGAADALRSVIYSPKVADDMRAAGLARAKQLCWEQFAADNIAIYRELLSDN